MVRENIPQQLRQLNKLHLAVIILLLATLLRFLTLGRNSFWLDEAQLVTLGAKNLSVIWFTGPDIGHPPLYYTFIHFWLFLGRAEMLVRLPSALASIVGIALTWRLGQRLAGKAGGFWASALLAFAPLDVWYAQEARMYSILLVGTLALALILVNWASDYEAARSLGTERTFPERATLPQRKKKYRSQSWVWFGVILAFGLYIDFPMIVMWGGLSGLWLAWWWHRGRDWVLFRAWLKGSILGWGLFIPGIWYVLKLTQALNHMVTLPPSVAVPFWLGLILVLPMLFVMGSTVFLWPYLIQKKLWPIGMITGLLLVVGMNLFMLWPHYYLPKRLAMILWPYIILGLVWLLVYAHRRRLLAGLVLFSLMTTGILLSTVYKDDWRGAVAYINHAAAPGDLIWLASGADPLVYNYYQPEYPSQVGSVADLAAAAATSHTIWLISGPAPFPPLQAWLEQNSRQVAYIPFYRVDIWQYQLNQP